MPSSYLSNNLFFFHLHGDFSHGFHYLPCLILLINFLKTLCRQIYKIITRKNTKSLENVVIARTIYSTGIITHLTFRIYGVRIPNWTYFKADVYCGTTVLYTSLNIKILQDSVPS
ncbi:hypothetical protein X975_16662, partial [Stegodyphus mimosarum]